MKFRYNNIILAVCLFTCLFVYYTEVYQRRYNPLMSESHHRGTHSTLITKSRQTALGMQTKSSQMRILCWILTCPENHKTKAQAINDTWGKRCDKLIFVSTKPDDKLEVIFLNIEEEYKSLWKKTRETFKILYDRYLQEYDWFLKADDDTFVIMENLRYMLTAYDTENPIVFGSHYYFHSYYFFGTDEYMAGGAGYVLSREALRRYGTQGYSNTALCEGPIDTPKEDVYMSRCLRNLGVVFEDTRDEEGKERMFHFSARNAITGELPKWHFRRQTFTDNRDVSDMAISFHWLKPKEIYEMEYFLYKIKLFGISAPVIPIPIPIPDHPLMPPDDAKSIPMEKSIEADGQRNLT